MSFWRRVSGLFLMVWLWSACDAQTPGSVNLVFSWPEGVADWSSASYSVWGRLERWPEGDPSQGTLVGEAKGPTGAPYAVLGPAGSEALSFSQVTYDDTFGVIVTVRQITEGTSPSTGDPIAYYGASEPFSLSAGEALSVEVPLALQPAPGVAELRAGGAEDTGGGALWVCPLDAERDRAVSTCDTTHVKDALVSLYLRAPHASEVVLANDLSLSKGRQRFELDDPERFEEVSPDVFRLLTPWDLNAGLGEGEGERTVFMLMSNDYGLESDTFARSVVLDTTPPEVLGVAIEVRSPEALPPRETELLTNGATLSISVVTSEPLPSLKRLGSEGPPTHAEYAGSEGGEARINLDSIAESAISFVATYTLPQEAEGLVDGPYAINAELIDLAGNVAQASLGVVELLTAAPMQPQVDTPEAITYHREPWGSESSPSLSASIEVAQGVRPHNHRLLIYSGADWCTSQLLGVVEPEPSETRSRVRQGRDQAGDATRAEASLPTAATKLDLAAGNRASVYVLYQDPAGNLSLPSEGDPCEHAATRVRDVTWRVTMGDKVAGDTTLNPHRFVSTEHFEERLHQGGAREVGGVEGLLKPDADPHLTSGAPLWRKHVPRGSPTPRAYAAMTYDSARGVSVLYGGFSDSQGTFEDIWEHDGLGWRQVEALGATPPDGPWGYVMVYDARRGVTVLFGGTDGGELYPESLWEWDGASWTEHVPSGEWPAGRVGHSMTYDAARGVVVLFGGEGAYDETLEGFPSLNGTWEWNGSTWAKQAEGESGPSFSSSGRMTYDSLREVSVYVEQQFVGEEDLPLWSFWEWTGEMWIEVTETDADSSWLDAVLFSPSHGKTLLFDVGSERVWSWDGAQVAELEQSPQDQAPGWRDGVAFAYDRHRQAALHFGGMVSSEEDDKEQALNDTWAWRGDGWRRRTPSEAIPGIRHGAIMFEAPLNHETYLFGGGVHDGGTIPALQDLWAWDGAQWREQEVSTPWPPGRLGATALYDPARGASLIFGGLATHGTLCCGCDPDAPETCDPPHEVRADLWEFDGTQWSEQLPSGPTPQARTDHAMVYDQASERSFLFGGTDYDGGDFGDTWAWTGEAWSLLMDWESCDDEACSPSARAGHAMAYDPQRATSVLFGGGVGEADDTWEFDGETWTERTPSEAGPEGRSGHTMVYDPSRGTVLLHGGTGEECELGEEDDVFVCNYSVLNGLWAWDGETWTVQSPEGDAGAPARAMHTMLYKEDEGHSLIFGGQTQSFGETNELWTLDTGASARPGQQLIIAWPRAQAEGGSEVLGVSARWHGGGLGYEAEGECAPIHGADLKAWTGLGWTTLASTSSGPDSPEPLTWSTTNPEEIQRLFFGLPGQETLSFSLTPKAPNGCGTQYAQVATDYVEATLTYRLPPSASSD